MLIYKRQKMTDYSKGKIYKIVVNNTEDEYRPYIGSTTKEYLSQRFTFHKANYKSKKKSLYTSAYLLFDKYGIENCNIILIENYPCTTKDELRSRERYWFDNIENCNKIKPIRTETEIENYGKIRYKKRIDCDPECNKKNYQRELEMHPDRNKKHYQRQLELHPDRNKVDYAKRLELNPNYIKQKYKNALKLDPNRNKKQYQRKLELHPEYLEPYICVCGSTIKKCGKYAHEKSKKHTDYIANIVPNDNV